MHFTFEDTVELGLAINRLYMLTQIFDNFGIMEMKLGNLNIPLPPIDKLASPVRF
jgi:hypothetical protein